MIIPEKIKIGGNNWTVKFTELHNPNANGCADFNKQEITIENDIHREQQELILIHEILEIINGYYDLELPHNSLSILETALYQVLKDNDLFAKEKGVDEQYDVEPEINETTTHVYVIDKHSNPVYNAVVALHNENNDDHPVIAANKTNEHGMASFSIIGDYHMRITKEGCKFKPVNRAYSINGTDLLIAIEYGKQY